MAFPRYGLTVHRRNKANHCHDTNDRANVLLIAHNWSIATPRNKMLRAVRITVFDREADTMIYDETLED